jgi:hypothetical protein
MPQYDLLILSALIPIKLNFFLIKSRIKNHIIYLILGIIDKQLISKITSDIIVIIYF